MTDLPWTLLVALGFLVGGFGTLIGAGGGFLLVPLLLYLYPGESPASLTSISLAVVALNALSGATAYAREGRIHYRIGFALSAAGVPGTMAGAALTRFIPRGLFDSAFGVILLVLALTLFRKVSEDEGSGYAGRTGETRGIIFRGPVGAGIMASALVGWLSGVMGIGGSPLQVVVLTHLMGMPVHAAMPTAQFMVLLSAIGGVGTHLAGGDFTLDLSRVGALGIGALAGAQLGAAASGRITGAGLLRLLALAVSFVGARLLLAAF